MILHSNSDKIVAMHNSTERFSDRVQNYLRYRPHYPAELIPFLTTHCALTPYSAIADIGSGTGFLSELFLHNGNKVFGVEPNAEMRAAAERYLAEFPSFVSVDGTAEATKLPGAVADFVTAAQAFHWFDRAKARVEFNRILKPKGHVLLLWNDRTMDTPFLRGYENLLVEYGIDYQQVSHRNIDADAIAKFFGTPQFLAHEFSYEQSLDYDALEGRLLSSSYMPLPDHPRYEAMIHALQRLFATYARAGKVTFHYRTLLYAVS